MSITKARSSGSANVHLPQARPAATIELMTTLRLSGRSASVLFGVLALAACDDSTTTSSSGSGGNKTSGSMSTASGSMSTSTQTQSSGTDATSTGAFSGSTGVGGGEPACATQTAQATLTKKPVDIIIVVDNSGSMTLEIEGVQQNINQNFASIIEQSGLDYRVILVARHGSASGAQSICIEAPLSGIPAGGCATPPAQPVNNPPKFFHYSTEIASRNSWCKILDTFDTPDEFGLAATGWQEWLRPDSFKTFIEITDDGVGCTLDGKTYQDSNTVAGGTAAAPLFDESLLALSPANFGDATARNYAFYSIVAMGFNTPATKPYDPTDPVLATECPTAANPGTGHQALSVLTNSLRFPICDTTSYDAVFQAIAAGVISGAKVDCAFAVPDPPVGQNIDLMSVGVKYTPSMGAPTSFTQVANAAACTPGSFYIENMTTIQLCPEACDLVQMDDTAKIDVSFKCKGDVM